MVWKRPLERRGVAVELAVRSLVLIGISKKSYRSRAKLAEAAI
jgi:hypothetical protein